jgi:phosphohistidine phosphatase
VESRQNTLERGSEVARFGVLHPGPCRCTSGSCHPADVRLYLVRHAEAAPGHPDELRALTRAGRDRARELGLRLARERPRLDAVLSSPLLRARETAAAIAQASGLTVDVDERLAPGATTDDVRAAISGRGDRVVVVGHQPDCGEVAADLAGSPAPPFAPGAVHAIDLAGA